MFVIEFPECRHLICFTRLRLMCTAGLCLTAVVAKAPKVVVFFTVVCNYVLY